MNERLAKRFDPEQIKARAAQRKAEQRAIARRLPPDTSGLFAEGAGSETSEQETIDWKTPELFLPMELFDHLLSLGFPPDGRDQLETRRIIEERAAALGFGRDLWPRLGRVSNAYLTFLRERDRRSRVNPSPAAEQGAGMSAEGLLWCRARAAAFAAAKAEFGEGKFLRLLYGTTPGFSITYAVDDLAEQQKYLRLIEGGCQ